MANFEVKATGTAEHAHDNVDDLGLYMDGALLATWRPNPALEKTCIIETMLDMAFEQGKESRSREIRKLIG